MTEYPAKITLEKDPHTIKKTKQLVITLIITLINMQSRTSQLASKDLCPLPAALIYP